MATLASRETILASYAERTTSLDHDEAGHELAQTNNDDQHFNRRKITQKDLGNLSIIGSLSRVQYGRWKGRSACLICMRFQFSSGKHKILRIREADISIEFTARPPASPHDDPVIFNYGPKSLKGESTEEHRNWYYAVQFSAEANLGPVSVGPTAEIGKGGTFTRKYASSIETNDWGDRKHDDPNCVKVWIVEDVKQESSVPSEVRLAYVVGYSMPFQCTVHAKASTLLPMSMLWDGWPWAKDDPVLFEPLVEYSEWGQDQTFADDFDSLSDEDWRQLVTPDLNFR